MNENIKSVSDLLGLRYFIPSYQRGYRWTEQQVEDLLNDIKESKGKYCLQPLVVSEMSDERKNECRLVDRSKTWYEIIDGQQRLTTIFIICNLLSAEKKQIVYQTREETGKYLMTFTTEKQNLDIYFMNQAKNQVDAWFKETKTDPVDFLKRLKEECFVIWYESNKKESAYDVFKRLNSGKISLSNAELVKALLLNMPEPTDASARIQEQMAGEWDRMEQILHDDEFWYFINPEPESEKYSSARMDFILELILRCVKKDDSEDYLYNVDYELNRNNYFIFSKFLKPINREISNWELIKDYFRKIKMWYDNRELYHYIGYLMNLKNTGNKHECLKELISLSLKDKNDFLAEIKTKCIETLFNGKDELNLYDYEYGKHNDIIHNVLLLFNLATIQNQISEKSRYPFDKHFKAAKKKWSLEHIHAQNEKKINWDEDSFKRIKEYLKDVSVKGINELNKSLEKISCKDIDDNTYNAIIGAFMGEDIIISNDTFSSNFTADHHLTNLALLQGDKNAAFNNKIYIQKREKLAEYENVEGESMFVPICTRNVFFKHYSPSSTNSFLWDQQSGDDYLTAITKVLASYLELEVCESKKFTLKRN
ncbi:MAG: DUF262 domain-containing protein [Paludibacteraceae bacterium]|nr:DUF262 domain-containing protein [Paludibacteraceae bacterium]